MNQFGGGYRIFIEKEIFTFSVAAFKGCLAHELAHVVLEKGRLFFDVLRAAYFGDRKDKNIERNADLLVIERGLWVELYHFHKDHGKEYKTYNVSAGKLVRLFLIL